MFQKAIHIFGVPWVKTQQHTENPKITKLCANNALMHHQYGLSRAYLQGPHNAYLGPWLTDWLRNIDLCVDVGTGVSDGTSYVVITKKAVILMHLTIFVSHFSHFRLTFYTFLYTFYIRERADVRYAIVHTKSKINDQIINRDDVSIVNEKFERIEKFVRRAVLHSTYRYVITN